MALPRLLDVYGREWVDAGKRPLVIFATQGGDARYATEILAEMDANGDLRFVVYLQSEATEDSGEPRPSAEFQLLIVAPHVDEHAACEATAQPMLVNLDSLDPGPAHAYAVDQVSSQYSATNFSEAEPLEVQRTAETPRVSPSAPEASEGAAIVLFTGEIWGWFSDENTPTSSSVNDDGAIFGLECTLDSALVWRSTHSGSPLDAVQSTLFLPQFNLTSISDVTDNQAELTVGFSTARTGGATLVEAYPEPTTSAAEWSYWYDVSWQEKLGVEGNLGYTDQPTWLFANRGAARQEQAWLVFGGMAVGLAGTLLVQALSDLVDLLTRSGEDLSRFRCEWFGVMPRKRTPVLRRTKRTRILTDLPRPTQVRKRPVLGSRR